MCLSRLSIYLCISRTVFLALFLKIPSSLPSPPQSQFITPTLSHYTCMSIVPLVCVSAYFLSMCLSLSVYLYVFHCIRVSFLPICLASTIYRFSYQGKLRVNRRSTLGLCVRFFLRPSLLKLFVKPTFIDQIQITQCHFLYYDIQ